MKKRLIVDALALLVLALALILAMRFSRTYYINKYLAEREVWMEASYPIPYTDLRWSLSGLGISDNIYESGWKLSDFNDREICLPDGERLAISALADCESGALTDGVYIVTAEIEVSPDKNSGEEHTYDELCLPCDFLKLGNTADIASFSNPIIPAAVMWASGQNCGDKIYVAPDSSARIKLAYFVGGKVPIDKLYLFTNVIPTQTVSVCIPLKKTN